MLKVLTTGASLPKGTMPDSRERFGAALKAARERKGISLSQIAGSTKINTSLLENLENGDLSRWPPGLFRRSYLRDYANAVGLPVESTTAEFLELFTDEEPEGGDAPLAAAPAQAPPPAAIAPSDPEGVTSRRILAAAIDAGAVLAISLCSARVAGANMWATSAVVALGYYSLGTAWFGISLGERWVTDWRTRSSSESSSESQCRPAPREGHPAPHATDKPPARRRKRRRAARSHVVHMRIVH